MKRSALALALLLGLSAPLAAQKQPRWFEVRSPNFIVASSAGEKEARRVAYQFEQFRAVLVSALVNIRVDPGQPFIILAVKDEKNLRELLPAFWEKKGGTRPAGYFIPGPEKHYAALRLDGSGPTPYQILYHEYVHLLVRLNLGDVPLWLNEGLAEFYAQSIFAGKEVGLGHVSGPHLSRLSREKLLPLDVLFTVDHSSPHYNEAAKTSIFYAQSWALTHYLMIADERAHSKQLVAYFTHLRRGDDPLAAGQAAFGDLKQLEKHIDQYVRTGDYFYLRLPAPVRGEETYTARELTPAEAAALAGDFYAQTQRPAEARAALERAMQLDPKLAAPRESLGMLAQRNGDFEEARRWFAEAVRLESKSFLAHYYYGLITLQTAAEAETSVADSLRRAIELNPKFTPAYTALVNHHLSRGENLDEALELAKKAVELEPGEVIHRLNLTNVLVRKEAFAEAREKLAEAEALARTPNDRKYVQSLRQSLEGLERYQTERLRYEEEKRRARAEADTRAESTDAKSAAAPPARAGAAEPREKKPEEKPRPVTAPGEGKVSAVACEGRVMFLFLSYYGMAIELHSENYYEVEFLTTKWQPPPNFNPCQHLKGREVKVEYRPVTGKPYAGEIVTIEVVK